MIKRNVSAKSEVIDQNTPRSAEPEPLPTLRYRFARVAYFAAIAVTMLGWLSLIVWMALQLI